MSVVDTRFGHTEGRVCLAYNEKNNKVIRISHSYFLFSHFLNILSLDCVRRLGRRDEGLVR